MDTRDPPKDMSDKFQSRGRQNLLFLIAALTTCAAIAFIFFLEPREEVELLREPPPKSLVSVISVPVQEKRAVVETLAQIKPMWSAELQALHGGQVLSVSDRALAGRRVEQDDVLIEWDPAALLSDLRAAELAFVEAEVGLNLAREQTDLRRREALRVGDETRRNSRCCCRTFAWQKRSLSAQARVAAAEVAVANAKVRAPFSGFVTARSVSPGQSVSTGDALLSVVTGTAFEIKVGLSLAQWSLLEHPISNTKAKVFAPDGTALGSAEIRDAGGFRGEETRELRVFLEISHDLEIVPDVQLISSALVEVVFDGRAFDSTLQISESSLTREGDVWHVDALALLQRFQPDVLWRIGGDLIVAAPANSAAYDIATVPLASFLTGSEVSPCVG